MEQVLPEALLKTTKVQRLVKEWENSVFFVLLTGFTVSLFLPLLFTNIFTILLIAFTIGTSCFRKPIMTPDDKTKLALTSSLFLAYTIGVLYSSNISEGLTALTAKLSLLLFPIIFCLNTRLSQERQEKLLSFYVIAAFLISLFCFAKAVFINLATSKTEAIDWNAITYHSLSNAINFHAVYLSMYVSFAVFIILFMWPTLRSNMKLPVIFILLFLNLFIVLLSARIVLLAFILISFVATLIYAYKRQELLKFTGIYVLLLIVISLITLSVPALQTRVKEAINYNAEYSIDKQWGGRAMRLLKWECCIEIIKNNPVLGVGTGAEQDKLQECYIEKKFSPLLYWPHIKFNAHNQYFQTAIAIGLVGLVFLLANILYAIVIAVKRKQYLYLIFLFLISICFLTESMLQTNKGIVFYSFFNSFFLFSKRRN